MDPVRNPYAPGAGQRPPELAGRDDELAAFEVVLERVARGRVRSFYDDVRIGERRRNQLAAGTARKRAPVGVR